MYGFSYFSLILMICTQFYGFKYSYLLPTIIFIKKKLFPQSYGFKSSSSSCHVIGTDIPEPLSPLLPIVHRLWQVFRATSRNLT